MNARQIAFTGTSHKRKRQAPDIDPRLAALFADSDAWETTGGKLAWQHEQTRRRIALVARLRERRRNGYRATERSAA